MIKYMKLYVSSMLHRESSKDINHLVFTVPLRVSVDLFALYLFDVYLFAVDIFAVRLVDVEMLSL